MKKLVFVKNVKGDILSIASDLPKFLFNRAEFPCNLCRVMYGSVLLRKEWREFLDGIGMPYSFAHKDDFAIAYPEHGNDGFPAAYIIDEEAKQIITKPEIDKVKNIQELINLVRSKL